MAKHKFSSKTENQTGSQSGSPSKAKNNPQKAADTGRKGGRS